MDYSALNKATKKKATNVTFSEFIRNLSKIVKFTLVLLYLNSSVTEHIRSHGEFILSN